jgi:hypothetical protein
MDKRMKGEHLWMNFVHDYVNDNVGGNVGMMLTMMLDMMVAMTLDIMLALMLGMSSIPSTPLLTTSFTTSGLGFTWVSIMNFFHFFYDIC